MNIQTHCPECARAYQLGYASATEFYLAQLQKLLSTKSCPDPIMMEPPIKCAELQDTKVETRHIHQQRKQSICAIAVSYCPYAINSVEKTECSYDKKCPHKRVAY